MPIDRSPAGRTLMDRRRYDVRRRAVRVAVMGVLLAVAAGCGSPRRAQQAETGGSVALMQPASSQMQPLQPVAGQAATPAPTQTATQAVTPAVSAIPDPASLETALSTLDPAPAASPVDTGSAWANEAAPGGWGAATATPAAASAAVSVRPGPRYWGVATYYGADFQGQPMAAGPAFDMRDPTVTASNSWPLGTRLRITRIPGGPWDGLLTPAQRQYYFGHSIVVTVMDRGAFTHALDLSWGAFAELGNPAEGVIRVLIEPVDGVPPVKGLRGTPAGPDL
jgi:rare lipoprotein A